MQLSGILLHLMVLAEIGIGLSEESPPADAMVPEHVRSAIANLNDPSFQKREASVDELIGMGFDAIVPLRNAAETLSPEASVRAFNVLLRLYRRDDERTYEATERALRQLMHVNNLTVTARAERTFESISELRQLRGVAKFKRLGGVIHMDDQNPDRQFNGPSQIDYILLGRDWEGGDEGARLIECIQHVHEAQTHLIIVRGAKISDEAILDLRAELPFLAIQRRGPARLGVKSMGRGGGCVIDKVEPKSAADNAGLTRHDLILEIDGKKIDDFEALVEVVEKKEPGDRIPVIFQRDFETHTVVAELLPW